MIKIKNLMRNNKKELLIIKLAVLFCFKQLEIMSA